MVLETTSGIDNQITNKKKRQRKKTVMQLEAVTSDMVRILFHLCE